MIDAFVLTALEALASRGVTSFGGAGLCWSASASLHNNDTVDAHTRPGESRPETADAYYELITENEKALRQAFGVQSEVYLIPTLWIGTDPGTTKIYLTTKYDDLMNAVLDPDLKKQMAAQGQSAAGFIPNTIRFALAHEYAHQAQFAVYRKNNQAIPPSSPELELQADILAAYSIGQRVQRPDDRSQIVMMASLMGDPFFNDTDHHGDKMTRHRCVAMGIDEGSKNTYGALGGTSGATFEALYDWALITAKDALKRQPKGHNF